MYKAAGGGILCAESPGLNTKQLINRIKMYRKLRSDGLILPIKYENLLLASGGIEFEYREVPRQFRIAI